MHKKVELYTLYIIYLFIIYCSLSIGTAWDEVPEILRGNERLKYLFALGSFENYWKEINDEFYPGFYTTIVSFFTKMMPIKYEYEAWHLTNSLFSLLTVFGIYKISIKLFNKKVAKIIFLLCLFNPIFFGHMAINPKDPIIAFANVWTTYIFLRYLQNQDNNEKSFRYILLAGLTIGLGTGVRIPFLITLVPFFIFSLVDILFLKKLVHSNFSFKKFILHLVLVLVLAYILTILFWPHVHSNILTEPTRLFFLLIETMNNQIFGLPWMLFNGKMIEINNPNTFYLISNFFYKTPEFILLCYVFSVYLFFFKIEFFRESFEHFKNKLFLVIFIFLFPVMYFMITNHIIYDGLRLYLYLIPYYSIIPGLVIYYLISNFDKLINKIILVFTSISALYFLYVFVILTPYHYTYLNSFAGNFSSSYKKFENDYWGVSIKELTQKIKKESILKTDGSTVKIVFCGLSPQVGKRELNKIRNLKFEVHSLYDDDFDYVIMTNRIVVEQENNTLENLQTCFEKFKGKDLVTVKRNGLVLSTLRKKGAF